MFKECAPASILILLTLLPTLGGPSIHNHTEFSSLAYALIPYHVYPWAFNTSHYVLGLVFCAAVTLLLRASDFFPTILRSKLLFLYGLSIALALFSCVAMEIFAFDFPARCYFHKLTLFPVMLSPIILFSLLASNVRPYAALMAAAVFLLLVFKAELPIILYLFLIGCLSLLSLTNNSFLKRRKELIYLGAGTTEIVLILYLLWKSATVYHIVLAIFVVMTCLYVFMKKRNPLPCLVYSLILAGIFFHDFRGLTLEGGGNSRQPGGHPLAQVSLRPG